MGRAFYGFGSHCAEGRHNRPWWEWEGFGDFWGPRERHARGRSGRVFEQGDLKFVILQLLADKPRHGYEIIKELESRFGGRYAPSPGTVYPTLTMLEDLGYAKAVPEEGGKKIFEITEEGRKHLAEHSTTVNDIFDRIARFVEGFTESPMREMNGAFRDLAAATFTTASKNVGSTEVIAKVRDILRKAKSDIDAVNGPGK